jgi:two-component system, cell cycle sensor histidine kinase and response regulator CckA
MKEHSPRSRLQDVRSRLAASLQAVAASGEASLPAAMQELETCVQSLEADLAEREQLEAQFLQAQKMEAIGRLAGGIAHDFNNLLTAIVGYSELLLERFTASDRHHRDVLEILRAAEKAGALTRQLLAFSRKQERELRLVRLNEVVHDLERMLRRLIGEDIELCIELSPGVGNVRADSGQIEQVLMNLAVNARDAMPRGGRLLIETSSLELDERSARRHVELKPGPYAVLTVADTGHGMDPQTLAHLFEPFFTTKDRDKGTGLGLSTVYAIVRQSGGHVEVASSPGQGSAFRIYLPRIEGLRDSSPPPVSRDRPGGNETILLVEDEEMVRKLAAELLRQSGYTVLDAQAGPEALQLGCGYPGPIHLLITDAIMPAMSGLQLVEQLVPLRPTLKVLYMSGHIDESLSERGLLQAGTALLRKPFRAHDLVQKVREILDSASVRPL